MESDDNVSGEFQRSTRMPLDAVVRLHFQGTVAFQNGFAANVSATGMFVKHPAPPPLGTQLVFELNLGAERKPVQGAGEVVWVREKYLGPGQPAGVGIRFLQLDSQSRDHIAEALFEFLEQSLAEDSLLDSSGFSFDTEPASAASSASGELAEIGDIYGEATESRPDVLSLPAEPLDFAALERLPMKAAPASLATSGDSKRAFSVFSPLDEADAQTADIVRKAMREEPPLPPLPPLPMMAAAAAASSERGGSRAWLWLLLLVLVAGGGYFAFREWGASLLAARSTTEVQSAATSEPVAPAARKPEPLTAAPAPGTTLAESIGVDRNAISPAAAPTHSQASQPPDTPSEEPSDVRAAQEESAAAPAPESPTPVTNAPRPPAEPAPAAPGPIPSVARAERLTGIEWRESPSSAGETVLVLTGDGVFTTGGFSYSEIGGENPRVLIKLKGMQTPYRGPAPRGAGALVRGVRTGFHLTASGNEVHVVVDLARGGVKVLALEPQSAGLTLRLAP